MTNKRSSFATELAEGIASTIAFGSQTFGLNGILALVVTDLEGFTSLVERLGDQRARTLIRDHNALLRTCIRRRGGREVAHTGDGVIAAFRSVFAALQCAQEIQRGLRQEFAHEPLRARVGVHAGEPLPEDGRLFGNCVNAAVRVCSLARAEHVLVTGVVKMLAEGRGFGFRTVDHVRLRGLQLQYEIYELVSGPGGLQAITADPRIQLAK